MFKSSCEATERIVQSHDEITVLADRATRQRKDINEAYTYIHELTERLDGAVTRIENMEDEMVANSRIVVGMQAEIASLRRQVC